MIEFEIPGMKLVSRLNTNMHWRVRAKQVKEQRGAAFMFAKKHELPCMVTITRISPGSLDIGDNLPAACKAIRDGIADRLGIDDRSPAVHWQYAQEKHGKGVYGVKVRIEPMPEEMRVQCVQPSLLEEKPRKKKTTRSLFA